ncbi:hypothetical protein B2M20_05295 [Nitrobacter vulgaris]|uniref:Uncharacterized protein n=1 Tax=Nitrobacter vulgaris TaxID=29421 RepID=A0A1V4I1Y1_NITVU|nr:hypothetical protein B2M20_05295 [Nitrobacter vulgaris]
MQQPKGPPGLRDAGGTWRADQSARVDAVRTLRWRQLGNADKPRRISQNGRSRNGNGYAEQHAERRREGAIMVVIGWAVNVALGDVTMMDMHMTCEVAVVVHGTVQDNGWFRQYARGSRGLRNRHQHSLKQKRTHRQEHECSCERE